tara:strand:+ start:336 stop:545 length:210 start_codon:yes stop_codon:yes gene_type:complete
MEQYYTSNELSTLWGISSHTLRKWRWEGRGPKFTKIGRRVMYRKSDIETYANEHSFRSTTEVSEAKGGK